MDDIFRKTSPASALDRLHKGPAGGPLVALPARTLSRPGWIDKLTASRTERGLMRQEEEAVATVKAEQVRAATEVALAMTENAKAAKLKADLVENDRFHHEMEAQMMTNSDEAKDAQQGLVTRITRDTLVSEKQILDDVRALADKGQINPDREALFTEIIRNGTDERLRATLDLREMIKLSQAERLDRALSRKR
jgi:hypothetical protein